MIESENPNPVVCNYRTARQRLSFLGNGFFVLYCIFAIIRDMVRDDLDMPGRVVWIMLMSSVLVLTLLSLRRAFRRYRDEEFLISEDQITWRFKNDYRFEIRPWNLDKFEVKQLSFRTRYAVLTCGNTSIAVFDSLSCFDELRQMAEKILSEQASYMSAFR